MKNDSNTFTYLAALARHLKISPKDWVKISTDHEKNKKYIDEVIKETVKALTKSLLKVEAKKKK